MNTMYDLLISFAEVFAAMSPWLVVGFLAAGVIAVWIPRAWVNRVMGGSSGFSGVLRAVLVGVPLPDLLVRSSPDCDGASPQRRGERRDSRVPHINAPDWH